MALTKATLIDLNSSELILDLDADTSITADTDDTIHFKIAGSDEITMTTTALAPSTSDGQALGTSSLMFADLFLASGSVVNFNNGDVTLTHSSNTLTLGGGALDVDGGITVDNITIDGTEIDLSSGDLTIDVAGDIILDADGGDILIKDAGTTIGEINMASSNLSFTNSVQDKDILFKGNDGGSTLTALTLDMSAAGAATFNDKITAVGTSVFTNLDISGDVDVDGTTNLDVVDIDGAVDMATTLAVAGVVTANAGVVVDNITIDGTEIDLSSGDLTIDVAGDIILDADGGDWRFKDGGTAILEIANVSSGPSFFSSVSDADMLFKGNDGGSAITALTLDMSAAGAATFNDKITAVGTSVFTNLDISGDVDVDGTTNLDVVDIDGAVDMASTLQVDGNLTTSGVNTFTVTDNSDNLTLKSTDTDENIGPNLRLYRAVAGADDDAIGTIDWTGQDESGNLTEYASIKTVILDASDGTEDAKIEHKIMNAGALNQMLTISGAATIINEGSKDHDFRIEGNGDANAFFLDGEVDRIYLGHNANTNINGLDGRLQISGTDFDKSSATLIRYSADANPPSIGFAKSRNASIAGNTIVQDGDNLGRIRFAGADGGDFANVAGQIDCQVDGTPGVNDMPGRLVFSVGADGSTSATERMRIHSGGVVSIPGGIELGSGLDATAANLLDDYEEGTFTPSATFANDSSSGHSGQYTKVGNIVIVNFNITFSSTNFGATCSVAGLPFTSHNTSGAGSAGAGIVSYYDGTSTNLSLFIGLNATQVELRENADHLTHTTTKILGKNLRATLVYRTA